jgi:hypothetical protein
MRAITGLSGNEGFALELAQVEAARSAQRKAYGEVARLKRAMQGTAKKLNEVVAVVKSTTDTITAAKEKTDQAVQKTDESRAKAESYLASAKDIEAAAVKVKESVDGYQTAFAKFQVDLDNRNAAFIKGSSDIEKLLTNAKAEHEQLLSTENAAYEKLRADVADNRFRV